ncbi:hypothetical protein N5T82_05300 [Aliarcobacter cryaerophilus]|uniref:hypothetical protein n=1 Tax=Aliarcobacter cryaerophilus TaxID=28198 RepID=UPI0021B6BD95|nr:hypothetical protein [Aliarcobacter cryaerophilus]MCT7539249.1 hypothetical protein [Aliarcobacter cryaerophilus]
MKYYFIYSAGGGAGDWNGVKRVWNNWMPVELKSNILLKFGDVFYNHASGTNLIKPQKWRDVSNLREWLFDGTQDNYVLNNSTILLDSGTSKIVSYITHNNPHLEAHEIIEEFDRQINDNNIFQKYVNIINNSNINYAVTFDIPNTFKIRSQNGDTRRIHFNENQENLMIDKCITYCNRLYTELGNQDKILTTFSATWSNEGITRFLQSLSYVPNKLAIGGISDANITNTERYINNLQNVINFNNYQYIHFLGCGGFQKVIKLKEMGFTNNNIFSVDNSTPMNRAIDGNTSGTSQSGFICHNSGQIKRIKPNTIQDILFENNNFQNSLFSSTELQSILTQILEHQNHNSSHNTYDARAKLSFHNHDVFRQNSLE